MELTEAVKILQSSHREKDESPWQMATYAVLSDLQMRVAKLEGAVIESPGCSGDEIELKTGETYQRGISGGLFSAAVKPLSERIRAADQTALNLGYFREWADEVAAMETRLKVEDR